MAATPESAIYSRVVREIEAGLSNEMPRRNDALDNLRCYKMQFEYFPVRSLNDSGEANKYHRNSPFMHRVVDVLCSSLYKQGPKRDLPDHPEASLWLEDCYRKNNMDGLLQYADRLTHVTDFVAIQVLPSSDPNWPVKSRLWDGAHVFCWTDPNDSCRPEVVATLDMYDARRRLTVWTAASVTTFMTAQYNELNRTSGGTAYRQVGPKVPNTLGFLPFQFIHYETPITDFYGSGPGTLLRQTNISVNKRSIDIFDSCRYNLNPVILLQAVRAGHVPSNGVIRPGDVWNLPAETDSTGDAVVTPDAKYLQADSSFVAAAWDDQQNAIDHTLQMMGIPPAMFRMEQTTSPSGDAIVAEQLEPVKYAEIRQRKASIEEDSLARLHLSVGAIHLGSQQYQGYRVTGSQLALAASDPGLTLRWPDMYPKVPGQGQDSSDQWLLENELASRTQIVMQRMNMTEEEAESYLEHTAEHLKREAELFGLSSVAVPKGANAQVGSGAALSNPMSSMASKNGQHALSSPAEDTEEMKG